jgi:hypothetical protein
MLLSDAEFHTLQDRWALQRLNLTLGEDCPVCKSFHTVLHPLCGCSKHRVCTDCVQHAKDSDVKQCVFCPVPDALLHLQCPSCTSVSVCTMDALHGVHCGTCRVHFVPSLLRVFKRGPHAYTNFLTEAERQQLTSEFRATGGRVQCPTCRHPIERASACNELVHCGHEKVCAACGQFSFRWEAGLVQHRREQGCACVPNPEEDEATNVGIRWRHALIQAGVTELADVSCPLPQRAQANTRGWCPPDGQ